MGDAALNFALVEQVIGASPVGMAVIGGDGVYLSVNPAYSALYGYTAGQLLGHPFTMLFPPSQRASVQARHEAFLAGRADLDGEWDVVARDGRCFTVLATSVRVQAASGPARLVTVVDITPRKEAERELQATRQFIASVLDGLSAHICVLDETGRVLAVNRAWREFAAANGAPAGAELLGCSYVTVCEAAAQADDAGNGPSARFLAQLKAVLTGELEAFELEYPCHSPHCQRWFLARVSRIEGSDPLRVVVAHDDVTKLMLAQQVASDREETYRTLFETVPHGIVYLDLQGRITAANPAAQRILGLTLQQLQGLDSTDPRWKAAREDGSDLPGEEHPAMVALRTGQPVHDMLMGVQVPGRGQAWLLVNAVPLRRQGVLEQVYASFEDITARVVLGHELERQARTDELTGVASRRSILARLNAEFERLRRHADRCCAVLALDLDHFKLVNDRHGHAAGDAVLVHVVAVALKTVRAVDVLGRTGGEEFLVIAPDTSLEDAAHLAERLRQRVAESPASCDGLSITVTLSIGVTVMAADDVSAEKALARADRALYRAKAQGRDRVCVAAVDG